MSPRHCPATSALRNCCFNCRAWAESQGQCPLHCCWGTTRSERSPTFAAQLHLPTHDLFCVCVCVGGGGGVQEGSATASNTNPIPVRPLHVGYTPNKTGSSENGFILWWNAPFRLKKPERVTQLMAPFSCRGSSEEARHFRQYSRCRRHTNSPPPHTARCRSATHPQCTWTRLTTNNTFIVTPFVIFLLSFICMVSYSHRCHFH